MQFFNKLKTKAEDLSFKAQSAMAIGLMTAMAPIESAFADTKINSNVPTVNSDGSVTLTGGTTVLMGTAIGGGLKATVGLVLGLGAAFGMKFF